nr:MAG TPA: hypothetical protein [Caudoviricetes sp.]
MVSGLLPRVLFTKITTTISRKNCGTATPMSL